MAFVFYENILYIFVDVVGPLFFIRTQRCLHQYKIYKTIFICCFIFFIHIIISMFYSKPPETSFMFSPVKITSFIP